MLERTDLPERFLRVLSAVTAKVKGQLNPESDIVPPIHPRDVTTIQVRGRPVIEALRSASLAELAALDALFSLDLSVELTSAAFELDESRVRQLSGDLRGLVRRALGIVDPKLDEISKRSELDSSEDAPFDEQTAKLEGLASQLDGFGYQALVEFLEEDPSRPFTRELVERFVDGPLFWGELVASSDEHIQSLLQQLAEKQGGLGIHLMPASHRASFNLYVRIRFESLDDVTDDEVLAHVLGSCDYTETGLTCSALHPSRTSLARELARCALVPCIASEDSPFLVDGRVSLLFDENVLPFDAKQNLRTVLQHSIRAFEDLVSFPHLAELKTLVGCSPDQSTFALFNILTTQPSEKAPYLACKLSEADVAGLFFGSPEARGARELLLKSHGSLLGVLASDSNRSHFRNCVRERWPSLSKVRSDPLLAEALNLRLSSGNGELHVAPLDTRGVTLARKLVELRVYASRITPEDARREHSCEYQCLPVVVGTADAEHNRKAQWREIPFIASAPMNAEEDLRHLAEARAKHHAPFAFIGGYLSTPAHFKILAESQDSDIKLLRSRIFRYDIGLQFEQMDGQCLKAFTQYVVERFPKIEDITDAETLNEILGLEKVHSSEPGSITSAVDRRQWKLAKRLIELGVYEAEATRDIAITRRTDMNFLLMEEVVGPEMFERNRRIVLTQLFPDLDAAHRHELGPSVTKGVKTLLGLPPSAKVSEVARALVELGIVGPVIPAGHELPFRRLSLYFDPDVVGAFASMNVGKAVRERYESLDHIVDQVIANPYGSVRESRKLAAQAAQQGWLPCKLPEGQSPGRSEVRYGTTYFFDTEIVPPVVLQENVDLFLERLPHLDHVRVEVKGIRVLKEILGCETWQIAKRAVDRGLLPAHLTQEYTPPSEQGNFFDERVVGKEVADANRRDYRSRKGKKSL